MSNGNKQKYSFESYGLTIPGGDQQPKEDEAGYSFEQYGLEIPEESEWDALIRNSNNQMESEHNLPEGYENITGAQGALAEWAANKDMAKSEINLLQQLAKSEDIPYKRRMQARNSLDAIYENVRKYQSFGEGAQYVGKRMVSILPFVEADWQKHRGGPLEFAARADPDSPKGIYDPGIAGIGIGFGQTVGVHDVADMMATIGEFAIIGGMTTRPFQLALKYSKGGKMTSGLYRMVGKTKHMKRILPRVAKANTDFGIHNFTTVHPEDTAEGATLKTKLMERIKKIPSTALSATLFGTFGGLENVYAQYGGVFAAGYLSTLQGSMSDGMSAAEAHGDAFKSGLMLVGAHGANVLGRKGGEWFKKYMTDRGMSNESAEYFASHIVEKKIKGKEAEQVWKTTDESGPAVVRIVKETKLKNKQKGIVFEDVESDIAKPQTMSANRFYKKYTETNRPEQSEKIQNRRKVEIHKLQRQLKMTDADVNDFKRKTFGVKGEARKPKEVGGKLIELPSYLDLPSKTVSYLKDIANYYGVKYGKNIQKPALIELIEKNVPRQAGKKLSWADANPRQLYEAQVKLDKQVQIKKTAEDVKLGIHTDLIDQDGNKVYYRQQPIRSLIRKTKVGEKLLDKIHPDKFIPVIENTDKIISQYDKDISGNKFNAEIMAQQFNDVIYKHNLGEKNFRRIAEAMWEKGKVKVEDLSKAEAEVLDLWRKQMEQGGALGMQEGIFDDIVENYLMGIYKPTTAKGEGKVRSLIKRSDITARTPRALEKVITFPLDIESKKGLGLTPELDMRILSGNWWQSVGRAVAQKNLARRLSNLPDQNGNLMISEKAVRGSGYVQIDIPALNKEITGSSNKKVWVHPDIAPQLKILQGSVGVELAPSYWRSFNNAVKRVIMLNPLIHGWNIYSDVMDEYNLRMIKAGRVVLFGEKDWLLAKKVGMVSGKKEWKSLSEKEQANIVEKMYMEMASEGIDIAKVGAVSQELEGMHMRNFGELSPSNATMAQRLRQLGGRIKKGESVWEKTHIVGRSMRLGADSMLWDRVVRNSQIAIYAKIKSDALKKGLSEKEARNSSAHYTKDLLGMLERSYFSAKSPFSADFLNFSFFARNWTVSNARLVTGALGYRGARSDNLRFLSHRGLNKGEMQFLQERYTSHLIKGMLGMIATTNIANYLITGSEMGEDKDGKVKFKFNKDKAKWATENEPGHELDIDTGTYDNKGRKVYVTPPIFRYMRDYVGWFGDFRRTLLNKIHPVPKAAMETLTGMFLWNDRKIVEYPEETPAFEIAKKHGKHLLHSLTPYGQFAGRPDEVRTWVEKVTPWIGTWVRHGVAGGEFSYRLNTFARERDYELDEIDTAINLMVQRADIASVVTELISRTTPSGRKRYKNIEGIINRIMKYKNPLNYKYNFVLRSKEERMRFMQSLTPSEQERFKAALNAGFD